MDNTVYYVGGLDSGQKGAVGTHASGIISGLKQNHMHVVGVFLADAMPFESCHEIISVAASKARWSWYRKIIDRIRLVVGVRKARIEGLRYHRFDPFLSPFLVDDNTILEYNDDTVAQVHYALRNGQWGPLAGVIRKLIYPLAFRLAEKRCFRKAAKVVCVTAALGKVVTSVEPSARVIVTPNGSDAVLNEDTLATSCFPDQQIRLAHVGTLTPWDGLLELLDAMADFIGEMGQSALHFDIIGSGSIREKISVRVRELGIEDSVRIRDPVPHGQALQLLHHVDVVPLLKTIDSYGLSPMKFYEAQALGCYLITSDIPHINEISSSEGRVVAFPLERKDICSALSFVFANLPRIRADRVRRARNARERVSWKSRVRDILEATST
jgi:glycosyltransferase involved in cell wall biosynthesis